MGITFGSGAAPSQVTLNFDALFSQSLSAYSKTLIDQIGASNALLHKLLKGEYYESFEGSDIRIPLMYALATMDSYDGYDELSTLPMDGVTTAVWESRQLAVPIVYSMKEVIQNKNKIADLVKTKIKQAEMGFEEGFAVNLVQGSGDGAGRTPKVSGGNGSSSIDPLAKLIDFTPTTSTVVGNINQSTSTWWRNKTKTSAATTYDGLLIELTNLYNTCALGTGGPPDLILVDQTTYELITFAIYQKFRLVSTNEQFPFENTKFHKALIVMDDKVPDVYSDTTTYTYGTAYFVNSQFFRIKYEAERDFAMLKDENGKTFAKPINGDSRVGHLAWMGNVCVNNRRKHGVLGKIARTLTA